MGEIKHMWMRSSEYQENKKGRKNYTYDILGVDERMKKTQAFLKKGEKAFWIHVTKPFSLPFL